MTLAKATSTTSKQKGGRPAAPKATKPAKAKDPTAARAMDYEETRRENAIARIREAAESAGVQKARMGLFIERLNARMARSVERVEKLVAAERERQAKALEKYPEFKQLNGKAELAEAAKIPDVEIPESELPAYITNMKADAE